MSKWIYSTERVPKPGEAVLVYIEEDMTYSRMLGNRSDKMRYYTIARFAPDGWYGGVYYPPDKCIAWMPLPKPPQSGQMNLFEAGQ